MVSTIKIGGGPTACLQLLPHPLHFLRGYGDLAQETRASDVELGALEIEGVLGWQVGMQREDRAEDFCQCASLAGWLRLSVQ